MKLVNEIAEAVEEELWGSYTYEASDGRVSMRTMRQGIITIKVTKVGGGHVFHILGDRATLQVSTKAEAISCAIWMGS